jgi:hypothetical protein
MAASGMYHMNESIRTEEPAPPRIRVLRYYRYALWLILAVLFALDIVTTSFSLQQGFFEKNPFMIPFADNPLLHGIVKIGAFIFLVIVIETAVRFIREKRWENEPFWIRVNYVTLYGLILFALVWLIWIYFFVLINNIAIIS